ncbi:MAG: hypothetical protein HYR96_10120, partial [Deltaproteobacteria bacterium]|nr:hypothetical protein [Deltaproteobacteria bacterium]
MSSARKKRNYFPEPKFQFRFLALLVGGIVFHAVVTCAVISYFVSENYTLLVQYGGLEGDITRALQRELAIL